MKTMDPALHFEMDTKETETKSGGPKEKGFFQTSILERPQGVTSHSERFDLIVGSGGKGQTYLYWKDDLLFQLPVSYWREMGWINSPGYPDGLAIFGRGVSPRCLECHATYFQAVPPDKNRYLKDSAALGIQCEKCHGPGANHVASEITKPGASPTAVLNPARFSRDRQMDLCAWCHSGIGLSLVPPFSYVPGDSLEKYLDLPTPDPAAPPDVHSNQIAMLKRSRCYVSSGMTCLTCHDLHVVQHDDVEFSRRCLSCHNAKSATFAKSAHPASANCIDCHMPLQETNVIVFNWKGTKLRPKVRSHWIKVYSSFNPAPANP
jgi:hypothetical protein